MDTKKLRQKILDLAIRGKLVPQDPNDEPASLLLERIRAEKERLIKEGKIKRSKKTAEDETEAPFEIPGSWEWCRLDNLAFYKKGPFGSSLTKSMFVPDTPNAFKVYEQKNAINKDASLGYYFIDAEKYEELIGFAVSPSDIIVSCAGTIGETYVLPKNIREGIINQALMLIRLYDIDITDFYLLYFDFILKNEATKESKGTAIKNIPPFDVLKNFRIPIPPLAEQKRIVKEVEHWFTLMDELESNEGDLLKAIDKAKSKILDLAIHGKLVPQDPNDEPASVLLNRIREEKKRLVKEGKLKKKDLEETPISEDEIPFDIPDSWEWCRIKDIFIINPKVIADDNADAAFIPMEKIEACYGSRFSYEIRKWKTIKSSFTCFADGDVAFAKITPCFQNRKSMILNNLPNGIGAGTTELKVLRQYSETIERKYLLYFLASSYFIDEATFKGTANQQRIIVGYLENKLFPLPPLAEQKRIVAKIEEAFKAIDALS